MHGFANAFKAEVLKGTYAAPRKIALIAPLPFCLLGMVASGLFGGGGAGWTGFATYGWNWWYVLMLPVSVALIAASVANIDARQRLRTVLGLPHPPHDTFLAKTAYVLVLALAANLAVMVFAIAVRLAGGNAPAVAASALTAPVLTLAVSWMVPAGLFLTMRFGTLTGIAVPIVMQIAFGIALADSGLWWAIVMATGMRVASPLIGVAPSGIPLAVGDPMGALDGTWFLALAVATAAGIGLTALAAAWFDRREAA